MNKEVCDLIIVGAGLDGASVAYSASKRKRMKIAVFDQFNPPHQFGSSHGNTKVTRRGIGEGDFYSEFAIASHERWHEVEQLHSLPLYQRTGVLIMASPSSGYALHGNKDFLKTTEKSALKYRIGHRMIDNDYLRRQFPEFNITDERAYFERTGGLIIPENCVRAQLDLARKNGVELKFNDRVHDIIPSSTEDGVEVRTDSGKYYGEKIVICAGAWISKLLPNYSSIFTVSRQVQYYFDIRSGAYDRLRISNNFPVFIWQRKDGFVYGFPAIDGPQGGLKLASELVNTVDPDKVDRAVPQAEINEFYESHVKNYFPDLLPRCIKATACLYTSTQDRHFVVDYIPGFPQVYVVSACSGHGAKHSGGIGRAVDELVFTGKTSFDLSHFKLSRFNS